MAPTLSPIGVASPGGARGRALCPDNPVSDNGLAKSLVGWEPKVSFSEGPDRSIPWFFDNQNREELKKDIERQRTER